MHVLVEGPDDREFFDAVIRPMLRERYNHVQVWEYAGETIDRRRDYLRSIRAMNADYIFVGDFNTSPCLTARRGHFLRCYEPMLDAGRIIVVRAEIESWYLAGVDDQVYRDLGIPVVQHTDNVTKEDFERLMPTRFDSVADFMAELLRGFRPDVARTRNRSFCYLMDLLEARSKEA